LRGATVTFRSIAWIILVAQLCACASVETLPDDYETPSPLPRSYLEQFCYQPSPVENEMVLIKEKKSYRVFEGSISAGLDGADDDSRITFEFYEPSDDSPSPVVLLLPILNGQKHLMRPFATPAGRPGRSGAGYPSHHPAPPARNRLGRNPA
jgi:hypothetical protein